METSTLVDRIVTFGVVLAALGFAWITASQFSYVFVFDAKMGALNADAEYNAFSWASSVVTFTGAFLAALLAAVLREQRGRFLLLALTLALFSFDDTVQLHEDAGTRVADALKIDESYVYGVWPVIFFPLLAFAFLLLWHIAAGLPPRAANALRIGLGLLLLGVLAEGLASFWYGSGETAETFGGAFEIAVEEGSELAGWVLVGAGLTAAACRAIADAAQAEAA